MISSGLKRLGEMGGGGRRRLQQRYIIIIIVCTHENDQIPKHGPPPADARDMAVSTGPARRRYARTLVVVQEHVPIGGAIGGCGRGETTSAESSGAIILII